MEYPARSMRPAGLLFLFRNFRILKKQKAGSLLRTPHEMTGLRAGRRLALLAPLVGVGRKLAGAGDDHAADDLLLHLAGHRRQPLAPAMFAVNARLARAEAHAVPITAGADPETTVDALSDHANLLVLSDHYWPTLFGIMAGI